MNQLGERLKEIRLRNGLSLRELARQADVSPSFISQIENGKSQPSVATLYIFSKLLNVTVDELFDDEGVGSGAVVGDGSRDAAVLAVATAAPQAAVDLEPSPLANIVENSPFGRTGPVSPWQPSEYSNRVSVVHPSHRPHLTMAEGVVWERLAATPEHAVNFMKIAYAPGAIGTTDGNPAVHGGYEYGYVLSGTVEVTVGDEVFVLHPGESLGFDSSIPHVLRNPGPGVFEGVWFVHGNTH